MTELKSRPHEVAIAHLITISNEQFDHHGYLCSTAALRAMGRAATILAGSTLGRRLIALSTERVSFLSPVPTGHTIAFRASLTHLDDGSIRVEIEGLARFGGAIPASLVMTGSFVLAAVDDAGKRTPIASDTESLRVA